MEAPPFPEASTSTPSGDVFPFHRDDYNLFLLLQCAWKRFVDHPAPLVIATVALFAVGLGLGIVREILLAYLSSPNAPTYGPFGSVASSRGGITDDLLLTGGLTLAFQSVQAIVGAVLELGVVGMALKLTRFETPELGEIRRQAGKFWKYVVQQLVVATITLLLLAPAGGLFTFGILRDQPIWVAVAGLLLMLALVPLVYVSLGFSFARAELVFDGQCGPFEGLKRSWHIARDHRIDTFLVGLVNVGLSLIGLALCCIGTVVTTPLTLVYSTMFYLALRDGADVPAVTSTRQIQYGRP